MFYSLFLLLYACIYLLYFCRCCLMIDAMSLRQHIHFNHHTDMHIGCVDLGNGAEQEETAKEALVFMLVGICGGWKAPVAYYFTRGLSAEAQKELVSHCIDKVHSFGLQVCALTMDGHPTNVSMVKLMGAEIESSNSMKTYINTDEKHKTYVILDACHMVKLVRNMLHTYKTIVSSEGKSLGFCECSYLVELHLNIQLFN